MPDAPRFDWFAEMGRNTKRVAWEEYDSNNKFWLIEHHSMEGMKMLQSLQLNSMNKTNKKWVDGELVEGCTPRKSSTGRSMTRSRNATTGARWRASAAVQAMYH